jgi:hypothetical protein
MLGKQVGALIVIRVSGIFGGCFEKNVCVVETVLRMGKERGGCRIDVYCLVVGEGPVGG